MGLFDTLNKIVDAIADTPEQSAKPVDSLEQQRIEAINEKKNVIYQAWVNALVNDTTQMYKLNRTSQLVGRPRELSRLGGPEISHREVEQVIKKAAHDAFDSLGLQVGGKVKFDVRCTVTGGQEVTVYLYY